MNQSVWFHEAAEAELSAAFEWYRLCSERAAARFLDEISQTLERIRHSSQQFPFFAGLRRGRL